MTQENVEKTKVRHVKVSDEHAGRRIDNFLVSQLQGVPKTRLYQMLRKGEVRVNSGRVKQGHRLQVGDDVRTPPTHIEAGKAAINPSHSLQRLLKDSILYEDKDMVVLNKPAGVVVHGGSGYHYGIIETLRLIRSDIPYLELVHRLDKDTSGCLMIAKDHRVLRALHEALRNGSIKKNYLALLKGRFERKQLEVSLPLRRDGLQSGERVVRVQDDGKQAHTCFIKKQQYSGASLVSVKLLTGRTHQIRVHASHIGHPVAGDAKYGDRNFNKQLRRAGLRRLFLHAETIEFNLPHTGTHI
ncbi:MAG: RluA family pseudouridine synthase, partial [Gammaproteobacteria bacterium]